jgi:ubiquinone/menaquinone biosynthesis C-methylase UbiE
MEPSVDVRDESQSLAYYDEFSKHYDDKRGGREPHGYHDLVDDLEVDFVERFATNRDLLEVGCGTGLLLQRFARFARSAKGIDLSPGMLEHARSRGLDVTVGSATDLPFPDASFDVTCSFKVLPHVPDIDRALAEMQRVTRPGGVVIAEFYNAQSLRALAKRLAGAQAIGAGKDESSVFVRLESVREMHARFPASARLVATRGIRIVTPAAAVLRVPGLRHIVAGAERALADTAAARFAGFYVVAYEKASPR